MQSLEIKIKIVWGFLFQQKITILNIELIFAFQYIYIGIGAHAFLKLHISYIAKHVN